MSQGNRTNHPKKYVRWADWEAWLLKEWYPFRNNHIVHMQTDITWLKRLMVGLLFVFIAGVIAVVVVMIQI